MLQTDRASVSVKAAIKIAQLPNLGPKSAAMLASVGITTLVQLREFGAVAAYVAVKRGHSSASLNLLYALVAALESSDWKTIQRERKLELMLAVEDAMKNDGRKQHG
jgi:DNA transformation protein and related proteins